MLAARSVLEQVSRLQEAVVNQHNAINMQPSVSSTAVGHGDACRHGNRAADGHDVCSVRQPIGACVSPRLFTYTPQQLIWHMGIFASHWCRCLPCGRVMRVRATQICQCNANYGLVQSNSGLSATQTSFQGKAKSKLTSVL